MRKEKDALGEVLVPEEKYFAAQTQRAVQNFDIGREYFPREFIRAHAIVKKAAARVMRITYSSPSTFSRVQANPSRNAR